MEKTKERNSQIELLRILAMVLIICHHIANHGFKVFGYDNVINLVNASLTEINNTILLKSFVWPGKLGVGLFMMITGWYATTKDGQPAWKKINNVYACYFFYNFISCIVTIACGTSVSLTQFLPIFSRANWYVNGFLLLMVFMPLILTGLDKLTEQNFRIIAIACFVIDLLPWRWDSSFWAFKTYVPIDTVEFVLMLVIAQYIKKYKPKFFEHKKLCVGICLGCIAFITVFYFAVFKIGLANNVDQTVLDTIAQYSNCLFPIMSITLFMGLKDINIGNRKIINYIAGLTFGVYLFHDNMVLRGKIWSFLIPHMPTLADNTFLLLGSFLMVAVVFFVIAAVIEAIRKPLFKLVLENRKKIDSTTN